MADLQAEAKRLVGARVSEWIEDGMVLGLGTGSTAAMAIDAIGERIKASKLAVVGVATSFASERQAQRVGIPVVTLDDVPVIDLAFDGADEVDPDLNLIKGRGAAQTREKIVASQARRFVVLVDETKIVDRLGTNFPVPVEIVPMAVAPVTRVLENLGATPQLRMGVRKDGPVVSDQGLWIIDATFKGAFDPARVNHTLLNTPGVLDHGLFMGLSTDILVGRGDGTVEHICKSG